MGAGRHPVVGRGHDINYIGVAGALDPIGRAGGPPQAPLNLLGDFGGGAMYLVVGCSPRARGAGLGAWSGGRRGDRRRHGPPGHADHRDVGPRLLVP